MRPVIRGLRYTLGNRRSDMSVRINAVALRHAGSESARADAARALADGGDAGAEALLDGLVERDPRLRAAAAEGLAQVNWRATDGSIRVDAGVLLVAALQDRDSSVRGAAARALGRAGGDGAVEALVEAAADTVEDVRLAVAAALGRLAPNKERDWEYEPDESGDPVLEEAALEEAALEKPRASEPARRPAGDSAPRSTRPASEGPIRMVECPGCRKLAKPDSVRCHRCGSKLRP